MIYSFQIDPIAAGITSVYDRRKIATILMVVLLIDRSFAGQVNVFLFFLISLLYQQNPGNCTSLTCPRESSYLCPNGYCAESRNECLTLSLCHYNEPVRCDDGSCRGRNIHTGRSLCSASLTCPESSPYLCSDESCVSHPKYCPLTFPCPDHYYTCADHTCSSTPCVNVTETLCPPSRPIRCDNGFCTTSVLECSTNEGCMAPYECSVPFR